MGYPSYLIVAALCFAAGCTNSQSGPNQTATQVPTTSTTAEKGKTMKKIEGPIVLKVDWYHEDGICIQLQADGPCLKSPNDMRLAAPDLHKRYEHVGALAQIFHKFEPGISEEMFARVTGYQEWWAQNFEPKDFFDREQGYIFVQPNGLGPEVLHDAKLEGDKLIYFSARVIGQDHGIQAFRNVVDFASDDWSPQITELETTGQPRIGLNDQAIAIFGGLPEGFAHAKTPSGDVFLAAKPGPGASPFAWVDNDKKVEQFRDWARLVAKHPEAASPEAAKQLAYGVTNYPLSSGRQLIDDSAAYKKEYTDQNRSLEKLRYHVDQLRVTQYTIADWDAIKDPAIKDSVLVAYFRQGRQPSRVTYRLSDFANEAQVDYVDLASSLPISDTKDGPMLEPLIEKPSPNH